MILIYISIIIIFGFVINNKNLNLNYVLTKLEKIEQKERDKRKIIIFGRSTCEFGLQAEKFEREFGIPSYNLCSSAYEYEDLQLLSQLSKKLSNKDIIIFSKRFPFENENIQLNLFSNFFIPNIYGRLKSLYNYNIRNDGILSKRESNMNENGDKLIFKKRQEDFDFINYDSVKLNVATENLIEQLAEIEKIQNKNSIKIIVVSPPILSSNEDQKKIDSIIKNLRGKKLNKNMTWIYPLIFNNKEFFIDDNHVNKKGRDIWTKFLIEILEKNLN